MNKMKRGWIIAAVVLVLLVILVLTSIPRVTDVESCLFYAENEEKYPELYQSYARLMDENSLAQVNCADTVHIVTVSNFWSSCRYYILPCYITNVRTVPTAGSPSWSASLYMLTVCSNENSLAGKLCSIQVRNCGLELKPGANTFLYEYCEVEPEGVKYSGDSRQIFLEIPVDCASDPEIRAAYTVATSESAKERDEETTATFLWSYDIYCCGKQICTYQDVAVTHDYIVNA